MKKETKKTETAKKPAPAGKSTFAKRMEGTVFNIPKGAKPAKAAPVKKK